ncbi:hypothetical protein [Pedobacter boryungensis]|uniref:DUF2975 domain-containing protein n=1 Tax=Pedobacter boryungensis TaxID=869962 RepID=A0ABX2DFD6_9SPHI|nr:hypothetical protein [Pedobacter boryungensis]NQX32670.1 hypothetical protein [Pedobacter boryungensis]
MTIRTFWAILIKILGILIVFSSITVIPQFLTTLSVFRLRQVESSFGIVIVPIVLTFASYIFILWLFVFKTFWLIDKLHLEKGFIEERISFNIKASTTLAIVIMVIGGLMFVDSLPILCKEIFIYFQQKNVFGDNPTSAWIIFHFLKISISYLLMTNSKLLAKFICRQSGEGDEVI